MASQLLYGNFIGGEMTGYNGILRSPITLLRISCVAKTENNTGIGHDCSPDPSFNSKSLCCSPEVDLLQWRRNYRVHSTQCSVLAASTAKTWNIFTHSPSNQNNKEITLWEKHVGGAGYTLTGFYLGFIIILGELPRGGLGACPQFFFKMNMHWGAIRCILRHNFEKCYSVCTDLIPSGWFFRYSYLYTVILTVFFGG